jgi:hypothetical protein
MKRLKLTLSILLVALTLTGVASAASASRNFVAVLTGDQEVPPRETPAFGATAFHLRPDGSALLFRLIVANLENATAAHIHCGAAGVNGPVGVTLFAAAPGGGPFNGVLAEGAITSPDPGNACGWATLADVVAALHSGNTYVNVHTNDGVPPTNTGPGDFPGGEIRGQISER